jgi:hypothetical protein
MVGCKVKDVKKYSTDYFEKKYKTLAKKTYSRGWLQGSYPSDQQ